MIISLRELKFFLEVAALKSISKAAHALHITQPALSTKIKKIEQSLGFELFERTWEGVQLTQKGGYFLPYAVELLQSMEDATLVLSAEQQKQLQTFNEAINDSNRLRIGIDSWLMPYVLPRLGPFLQTTAHAHGVKIISQASLVLKTLVAHRCLDLAFFYSVDEKEDAGLDPVALYSDQMILLYQSFPQADILTADELIAQQKEKGFVLFDNPTLAHHSAITKKITERFAIQRYHVVDDLYAAFCLIQAGLAYTILTQSCALHLHRHPGLAAIDIRPLGDLLPLAEVKMAATDQFKSRYPYAQIRDALQKTAD